MLRQRAKSRSGVFHERVPNHSVGNFTAESQISQGGAFHGREPNHSVGHFTAQSQITARGISRQRAKSQGRAFHERGPNHRVRHVMAKGQITEWGISRERAKSQRGEFQISILRREIGRTRECGHCTGNRSNHRMRAFYERSAEITGCGISLEISQTTGCGPFIGCGPFR